MGSTETYSNATLYFQYVYFFFTFLFLASDIRPISQEEKHKLEIQVFFWDNINLIKN